MSQIVKNPYINVKISNFLFGAFIFAIFFPFIKVIADLDTQPTALLLGIIIFFAYQRKVVSKSIAVLGGSFIFSLFLLNFSDFTFDSLKNSVSYISMFFIPVATYYMLRCQNGFKEFYLKWVVYILFFVGFIQTFFLKSFLTFLLPRASSSIGRGVVGLATEPTTYGFMCLFLMFICFFHQPKKMRLYQALLLIQIIVFAKSSTVVLLLFAWSFIYMCLFFSFKRLILGMLFVSGFLISFMPLFVNTRLFNVLNLLISNPQLLFLKDTSAAVRFFHIFFSVFGAFQNFLIPKGFSGYAIYLYDNLDQYPSYVRTVLLTNEITNKIMSGYGAALFELGFVGLIFPIILLVLLKRFYAGSFRKFLMMSIVITLTLFCAIPLSFPYIVFIYGYLAYYSTKKLGVRQDLSQIQLRKLG